MPSALYRKIIQGLFVFVCMIVTTSLGLLMVIQGVLSQAGGNVDASMVNYLIGFTALFATVWIYTRGRRLMGSS